MTAGGILKMSKTSEGAKLVTLMRLSNEPRLACPNSMWAVLKLRLGSAMSATNRLVQCAVCRHLFVRRRRQRISQISVRCALNTRLLSSLRLWC